MVVFPSPGQQQRHRRHLDRDGGHEDVDGATNEGACANTDGGLLRSRRRKPRGVAAREDPGELSQRVERAAFGRRGQSRAPLPLHVLVQRDGVHRVADDVPGSVSTRHPT